MTEILLLDTFCKAGGASVGYAEAGFTVVGVDIEPQPNYPYEFHQGDAIEFIRRNGKGFAAVAGSPPCQGYSVTRHVTGRTDHPRLIAPTRDAMRATGRPYVIENVESRDTREEMKDPVRLCGSSFGLRVRRHRLFETNWNLTGLPCDHAWQDASKIFKIHISRSRGGHRMSGVVPVFGAHQVIHDGGPTQHDLERERGVLTGHGHRLDDQAGTEPGDSARVHVPHRHTAHGRGAEEGGAMTKEVLKALLHDVMEAERLLRRAASLAYREDAEEVGDALHRALNEIGNAEEALTPELAIFGRRDQT